MISRHNNKEKDIVSYLGRADYEKFTDPATEMHQTDGIQSSSKMCVK